jgi:hypothetical protein
VLKVERSEPKRIIGCNPPHDVQKAKRSEDFCTSVYVLAMVGHLKNVSPTFAQMPDRITNVEFTTVSPTIANTMLAVRLSFLS